MIQSATLPLSGCMAQDKIVPSAPLPFEDLARKAAPRMLRVANRLVYPDRDLAEDLVQEAIIQAFQGYRSGKFQLHSEASAQAWLMKSLMLQFLMNRRKTHALTGVDDLHFENVPSPAEDHEGQWDRRRIILAALATLSDDQRAVITLVDIEEYSYDEAAAMLNLPVGTVKSRLNRARWALAQPFAKNSESREEEI